MFLVQKVKNAWIWLLSLLKYQVNIVEMFHKGLESKPLSGRDNLLSSEWYVEDLPSVSDRRTHGRACDKERDKISIRSNQGEKNKTERPND